MLINSHISPPPPHPLPHHIVCVWSFLCQSIPLFAPYSAYIIIWSPEIASYNDKIKNYQVDILHIYMLLTCLLNTCKECSQTGERGAFPVPVQSGLTVWVTVIRLTVITIQPPECGDTIPYALLTVTMRRSSQTDLSVMTVWMVISNWPQYVCVTSRLKLTWVQCFWVQCFSTVHLLYVVGKRGKL